jgi:polyhydroxybutyrate depolymerase
MAGLRRIGWPGHASGWQERPRPTAKVDGSLSKEAPISEASSQFFHLEVGGHRRRYFVHKPADHKPTHDLPVVIMLHGAGATARWTATETGWDSKADEADFLAVFPEALPVNPDEATHTTKNPRLWHDGDGVRLDGPRRRDDVAFLRLVLDDLARRFPVARGRIYLTGFSNGAVMAFRLATEISEHLAALAAVSGHCRVVDPQLKRPMPTLFIIGAHDPLVPLAGGHIQSPWGEFKNQPTVRDSLTKWAKALGCPLEPSSLEDHGAVHSTVYGPGPSGVEMRVLVVDEHGHHWPGGAGGWSEALAGKKSNRLRATDVIWDFFRLHHLDRV